MHRAIHRSRYWAATLVTMALLASGGCNSRSETAKPKTDPRAVILITVEAIRPDLLSAFGGTLRMSNFERLASQGLVYEDATTVCPMSRPALATLMTGVAPDRTNVRDDAADRLGEGIPTMAEIYRDAGRITGAFVTTPFCSVHSGLDRGFDVFDGPETFVYGPARHFPTAVPGTDAALHFGSWLATVPKDRPLFAWIHLADLHGAAIEGEPGEEGKSYPEALAKVDGAVAVILDALEKERRMSGSEIVLVGTHGNLLGEEGRRGGTFWLCRETLRVPLLWKRAAPPSGAAGRPERIARKVWLPDVSTTLAKLVGGTLDSRAEGEDLARPREGAPERIRFAWTWAPDDQVAWPTLTAVDLGQGLEVFEWTTLRGESRADPASPSRFIDAARGRPATPRAQGLPAEIRARIVAEGVVLGGGNPPPVPPVAVRDPFLVQLQRLQQAFRMGRVLRFRKIMTDLLAEAPDNFAVLVNGLSNANYKGQVDQALPLAKRVLALYPEREEALHWAAHAALMEQEVARADALLHGAAAINPHDPDVLYDLACTRALSGDRDHAIENLRAAIDAGFRDWEWIERDVDLATLRADSRYAELMKAHGR